MMRRERGRVLGRRRTEVGPEAEDARPHRNNEDRDRRQVSLQAAGRADATQGAHEEAQVEPADVDAQPFQDIRVPPQMRAAHPTGVVEMRVRAFQSLTPAPLQGTPTRASNPSAVGVHRAPRPVLRIEASRRCPGVRTSGWTGKSASGPSETRSRPGELCVLLGYGRVGDTDWRLHCAKLLTTPLGPEGTRLPGDWIWTA